MAENTIKKPWNGRFEESLDSEVERFTSSIGFDKRLFLQDIQGSMAHVRMLGKAGIIPETEVKSLIEGLAEIKVELAEGRFPFNCALEDIHMNIEARLIEKLGPAGGKLHTARSRNDQVALDIRLYLREEIKIIFGRINNLQKKIVAKAKGHINTLMPGYTHLQRAQPVTFAHHLLAYFEMFQRDKDRLRDCLKRVQAMPLGSCALSGTSLAIDRDFVVRELGFDTITLNSMDAVSDRDFIIEFLAASSILMMHFSRLAEEIILWATLEFGFIELPDSLCTGSSIMPQKKNPDPIELVRGKTGRVYGNLMSLLVTMKSLPLTYNRDLQEDKEPLFDSIDTIKGAVSIMALAIERMEVKEEKMRQAISCGFLEATDLAEYLVKKGVAFRDAHKIVGTIVLDAIKRGWSNLSSFSVEQLKGFSHLFGEDSLECLDPNRAADRKDIPGGTAPSRVLESLKRAQEVLEEDALF